MKRFFSIVLGSFVGVWLALIVFSVMSVIVSFAIFGSMLSSSTPSIENKSVLCISLSGSIPERTDNMHLFNSFIKKETESSNLADILASIKEAKTNDKIKGIYIECDDSDAGLSTLYDIRAALNDFKKSKKFVLAYGYEGISQSAYYVASAADSIFINPIGAVDLHGLSATIPFYKNLLDKLGVKMQVVRVGAFKSAVEPFIATQASPENIQAHKLFMDNMWNNVCDSVSASRRIDKAKLNMLADSLLVTQSAEYLVSNRIVDKLYYKSEVMNLMKKLCDVDRKDDLNMVTPSILASVANEKNNTNSDQIAVVYAEGEIDGNSTEGINSEELTKQILDLADNDDVKALILRVNSPGGSAFGSEQIWKSLECFKKTGKPFAVSMGDMAASGGYYISCGANRIFAEPVTITGSIGIFGIIPCYEGLLNDKLGITQSVISTNANGDFLSTTKEMTPVQQAAMQKMINRGYELFTSRCANGRKMPLDSLKAIAQGRVWDGITAKKIGLVDEFGTLNDAINWVAKKANIKNYSIGTYPDPKDPFTSYLDKYANTLFENRIKNETGELYKYHDVINKIMNRDKVQCLMEPIVIR